MKVPVFVIDSSVITFLLVHSLQNAFGNDEIKIGGFKYTEAVKHCNVALDWVDSLAWLPNPPPRRSTIWVMDSKPYWRSLEYVDYKAGRKPKPTIFSDILALIEHKFCTLSVSGYEADDCAALIERVWRNKTKHSSLGNLFLLTNDTDWMGLANDGCFWVNVLRYAPRIRGKEECHSWIAKKMAKGKAIANWELKDLHAGFKSSDIWRFKSLAGDKSDNIPGGADMQYLIDLHEPPIEHRLWLREHLKQVAIKKLTTITPPKDSFKLNQRVFSSGVPLPFTPFFDGEDELEPLMDFLTWQNSALELAS